MYAPAIIIALAASVLAAPASQEKRSDPATVYVSTFSDASCGTGKNSEKKSPEDSH
jgi:hypothetical protein